MAVVYKLVLIEFVDCAEYNLASQFHLIEKFSGCWVSMDFPHYLASIGHISAVTKENLIDDDDRKA